MVIKALAKGFTLVELIIVIVIVGVLSTMTTNIITLPVKSYLDLERRTALADMAASSLQRLRRDIRQALPNSIRITPDKTTIEFLHTSDGGRYRAKLDAGGAGDILDFTTADNKFDVIGSLHTAASGYLVIYNTGTLGANAYAGNNLAEIKPIIPPVTDSIQLKTARIFPYRSPLQRFFIVDTPITYRCVKGKGELRRYDNKIDSSYSISAASPVLSKLNYKLQAKTKNITCAFTYDPGTNTRAGLVELQLTLTDETGEKAKLVMQVHVDNMP